MSIKQLNPYLNFNGDGAKAIALYQKAFGATLENVMRWGDVPGMEVPAADKERVMHAVLRMGGGVVMISDCPPNQTVKPGTSTHVCLDFSDAEEMKRSFDVLAEGGQVTLAIHDTFWGAKFGMVTDRFGVSWMFNCEVKKA